MAKTEILEIQSHRNPGTETLVAAHLRAIADDIDGTDNIAQAVAGLSRMTDEVKQLWKLPGSKNRMAEAIATHVLPTIVTVMQRFGVAIRTTGENRSLHEVISPSAINEIIPLDKVQHAISRENEYFEQAIRNNPQHNQQAPSFYNDLTGLQIILADAALLSQRGESAAHVMKQVKDAAALANRAIARDITPERAARATGEPQKVQTQLIVEMLESPDRNPHAPRITKDRSDKGPPQVGG